MFGFKISKINGNVGHCNNRAITVYTVLAAPSGPWNPANTTGDDKQQPWVSALEFAIATANTKGTSSPEAALSQLTQFLHGQDDPATTDVVEGYGMTYDTVSGARRYVKGGQNNISVDLTNYMLKLKRDPVTDVVSPNNIVNCYDQAAALTTLGRLLGIGVNYVFAPSFGYINTTTLVGGINTDDPFISDTVRTPFRNHAFAMLGDNVYDACAGPIAGVDFSYYCNWAIDFAANVQLGASLYPTDADSVIKNEHQITAIL